jgi:cytochrome c1
MVGPPLNDWSERGYIAGELPNNAENLIRWIMDPQGVEPGTDMPNLGVTEEQARDIAAYLFTLGR